MDRRSSDDGDDAELAMASDQRALERHRRDVLVWTSAPLRDAVEVVGEVRASLYVGSTARECDVVARLCVVRAGEEASSFQRFFEGVGSVFGVGGDDLGPMQSFNVCENVARIRFEGDGRPRRVELSLGFTACRFGVGDQVRLHVCSAAHPRWLRHPLQAEGEDWLTGGGPTGAPATQEVFMDSRRPSALELTLRGAGVTTLPPEQTPSGGR
ncbi:unnamed protein product [Prorocentrum cordatum]|uniref:Xaa-Pro dipeptidyl-peptidase C-terminal domain-containing protein n=1 Tax=Prorocentrum cordatum TaxID=2364126 RepID=A0ABN9S5N9_9DINO|nr:unnamed protein product [Polarella glacialis]